jgi:hypothetical protein
VCHIRWKVVEEDYNFSLELISIEGLQTKLWASKLVRVPILGILKFLLRSPGIKWHLGVGPMARHIIYYKGEGGGFFQLKVVVNFVNFVSYFVRVSFVHQKCSNSALTNLLFGLCRSAWIIELLVICPSFILKLQHALLPPKCCKPKNAPQFLFFCCLHLWTHS